MLIQMTCKYIPSLVPSTKMMLIGQKAADIKLWAPDNSQVVADLCPHHSNNGGRITIIKYRVNTTSVYVVDVSHMLKIN